MAKKSKKQSTELKKSKKKRTGKNSKKITRVPLENGQKPQGEVFVNSKHLLSAEMMSQVIHGKQVSSLAYEVGLEMHLSESICHDLIIAGFFHDIGKTVLSNNEVSDSTMMVEEMNSIREHPIIGYEILKKHGYTDRICLAVRSHHENCDASGYPENLERSEIPLEACILRVCDVFCALVQDRPYRSAFTEDAAMHMMIEEVEKYDLEVFLAFQRVLHRGENGEIEMPEIRPEVKGVWETL